MIFDQFQRYKTIEIIVNILREELQKETLTVLEIGANEECNLEKVLPNDEIQYSDLVLSKEMEKDTRFIQVDGCDMPEIVDGQFDVAIALDVFEHIPSVNRERFMSEINRVSKHMAIVCFPYSTFYNESAEKRVNAYYKMIFGSDHKWLIEHIENGLPQLNFVIDNLNRYGIFHQEFYHGDVFLWEEMMKALFTVYDLQNGGYYFEEIDRMYEEKMYFGDNSDRSYRVFMMLSNNDSLIKSLSAKLNEKYSGCQSETINKLVLRCIDDIKYRLINEQGRKATIQHQVYYTFDGKFKENDKFILTSESLNANLFKIEKIINIDQRYKAIRFDPIEEENCIVKNLVVDSNCGELKFEVINGKADNDRIVFGDEDPQIYINLENVSEIEWICINADLIRAGFSEAVIRYPLNWRMDNLIEQTKKNASESYKIQNLIMEYMQKQNEITISLSQCNERLAIEMEKTDILSSKLLKSREQEEITKKEKSQWEERCKYQEERCRNQEKLNQEWEEKCKWQEYQCQQWEDKSQYWENQSQFWEARCRKMEHTISWRITGILRKFGKLLGK